MYWHVFRYIPLFQVRIYLYYCPCPGHAHFKNVLICYHVFLAILEDSNLKISAGASGPHENDLSSSCETETPSRDVRSLYGRCYDIKKVKPRPYNVVLTSCTDVWARTCTLNSVFFLWTMYKILNWHGLG